MVAAQEKGNDQAPGGAPLQEARFALQLAMGASGIEVLCLSHPLDL
jgi:hypothetical protein